MSFVTVNDLGVAELRLVSPGWGAWHVDALIDSTSDLTGSVSVDIGGALTLSGTVLYGGTYIESLQVRIIAGKGAWQSPCRPKFYQGASLGMILADILQQGGESLSSTSNAAAKGIVLPTFTTTSGSIGANVRALMAYAPAGTSARFLADGSFWIGPETWPAWRDEYQVMNESTIERRMDIGAELPVLMAGQSVVDGTDTVRHVNRVETAISGDAFRMRAWWQA